MEEVTVEYTYNGEPVNALVESLAKHIESIEDKDFREWACQHVENIMPEIIGMLNPILFTFKTKK